MVHAVMFKQSRGSLSLHMVLQNIEVQSAFIAIFLSDLFEWW